MTFDSCRFDVLDEAVTPTLESYSQIRKALSPATYTYAAHQSFFSGILPLVEDDIAYYNRFSRQLLGISEVGETLVVKDSLFKVESDVNLVAGFQASGYQTIGAGAMNWFRQKTLQIGFDHFKFTGTDADAQIEFVLSKLSKEKPFFAFINFGETHAPFTYKGKTTRCPVDVRARIMKWPPVEVGKVGRENEAYRHQMECAEFLDSRLAVLFAELPGDTVVVVCGDHGECFGEDGYWGHGVNHPKVYEVPMAIFRLDRAPI